MALKTAEQYYSSLTKLNHTAYVLGEKVADVIDHPLIRGQVAGVAQTYALAHDPEGKENRGQESKVKNKKGEKLRENRSRYLGRKRVVLQETGRAVYRYSTEEPHGCLLRLYSN